MDILSKIIEVKRSRLATVKKELRDQQLYEMASNRRRLAKPHALVDALNASNGINIIAEFKRKSPSGGAIRSNINPAAMAGCYYSAGAKAISVVTEQDHFGGTLGDLVEVREAVPLPVLRKDFIFDPYQVYESAAAGADALLLIVSALDDEQLKTLREITEGELTMDALVEVHSEAEMERAICAGGKLIGVNNRNLRTLDVSIETSVKLANKATAETTLISESGLNNAFDLGRLRGLGYKGFLIGESLMRSENPELALRALLDSAAYERF